jgi:putative restriction endonuclease
LYFTLPFGQMHARNPTIIEVAQLLGRTPSSLAMKLVNFASLDPEQRARGIRGLAGHSRTDELVWNEFSSNWDQMTLLSEAKLQSMQSFFRKVVVAAYGSRCCITGNPVEGLLVASHILPWVDFPAERLNPRNGLCLAAHFDRAFDRGLISFDDHIRLTLSPTLRRYCPNDAIESEFMRREGQPLTCPERFSPDTDFLAYHRSRIFRSE